MLKARSPSMPGEDGLPHQCWTIGPAPKILFAVYSGLCDGSITDLPSDMRRLLMVFLPKGTEPHDEGPMLT
eukprot:8203458-Pyramimonas_sp.AAC.1